MSLKIIDKNLRTITTNAAKLNGLIHETAVLIAEHAQEHGDCTRALKLAKAMPASMRRSMLVKWFETYTPIRVRISNDRVGLLAKDAKGYTPFDIEAGKANPFYELAERNPEREYTFEDLAKQVERLAATIERRIESGRVPKADIPSAQAIVTKVRGLKFARVRANDNAARPARKAA